MLQLTLNSEITPEISSTLEYRGKLTFMSLDWLSTDSAETTYNFVDLATMTFLLQNVAIRGLFAATFESEEEARKHKFISRDNGEYFRVGTDGKIRYKYGEEIEPEIKYFYIFP